MTRAVRSGSVGSAFLDSMWSSSGWLQPGQSFWDSSTRGMPELYQGWW